MGPLTPGGGHADGAEPSRAPCDDGQLDARPPRKHAHTEQRIVPPEPPSSASDELRWDGWGFQDTEFRLGASGHVELTGSRYPLAGQELPYLLPFMRDQIKMPLEPKENCASSAAPPAIEHPQFLAALAKILPEDAIVRDAPTRRRHGHGHTHEEIYRVRHGTLDRVPDVVLYPGSEAEVEQLVEAAQVHGVCLIPYGGGTNVTEALRCPTQEGRMIASVDMGRMNRIEWIDPVNRMARIQAGAVGRHIQAQLESYGFTMGHEPDSIEHSTLGGWIATHASGMKKNRYGNIEDLVLDIRVVTASGSLRRAHALPRESTGLDVRRLMLGSEGCLGIITAATVRIFPLPETQRYGSVLFRSFEDGIEFLYELQQSGSLPASVRLMDNMQFQFGQALRPHKQGLAALRGDLERAYVTRLRGFDETRMAGCTLVFEGTRQEVAEQERRTYAIARRHGGLKAGSKKGHQGYQLTFGIAYVRDFVMRHQVLAESFETSVAWSDVADLCRNVKQRILDEHRQRGLPGAPFYGCRITQLYPTGVCVYFYFGIGSEGVENPSEAFADIERQARDEILRSGGSLSHHHGIGKLRQRFLDRVLSEGEREWIVRTKHALDPRNVFGAGNQYQPSIESELASDEPT